jgi:type II secretory pathway pseudopilin PulG
MQRPRATRGYTIIEVVMGVAIMALVFTGVMGAFIQSRRLTEGSVFQNSAITVVQGYLEQIKNMDFHEIPYYEGANLKRGRIGTNDNVIYTLLDANTPDVLRISSGAPLNAKTITPGTVPAGVVDNYKLIDINDTPDVTEDDLIMHLWVWVTPMEDPAAGVAPARNIHVVYTWAFSNGGIRQTHVDAISTIRSIVPTF